MNACECEHVAHTGGGLTPNGNPGHRYGIKFFPRYLTEVRVPYGVLRVCLDCRNDCLAEAVRQ